MRIYRISVRVVLRVWEGIAGARWNYTVHFSPSTTFLVTERLKREVKTCARGVIHVQALLKCGRPLRML